MVTSNLFRKDLYYRLNVVPIFIPPLRERRDDIIPLIFYFLEKFNKKYQREKSFSSEAIEALGRYNFSGNIRELANIIERLVVVTEKELIEIPDLPNIIKGSTAKEVTYAFFFEETSLKDAIKKCESLMIEMAIRKYGTQSEAAKALRVDQGTISRKIKKYSISDNVILHK